MRKKAFWSVLLLIGALPWEITSLIYPNFSLTKFATCVTVVLFFWGLLHSREVRFWSINPLLGVMLLIPLAGVISLFGAWNLKAGGTEILRLLSLWAMFAAYFWHVERADLHSITRMFSAVMLISALFGLLQYGTGHFSWGLITGSATRRANGTFIDPNIFARYLLVASLFVLAEFQRTKVRRGFHVVILVILVLGIGVSFSRTGWVNFIFIFSLYVILSGSRRWLHFLWGLPALASILMAIPTTRLRLLTLRTDITAGRDYLWQAGYWMFKDHPWRGVGIGNFQTFFENHFMYLLDGSAITRSHTYLVTIAAEMGLVGLLLTGIVFAYVVWITVKITRRLSLSERPWLLASFLGIIAIFISAQGEGRFFEDPLLWILLGNIGIYARSIKTLF